MSKVNMIVYRIQYQKVGATTYDKITSRNPLSFP